MELVREKLRPLLRDLDSAHAGLLLQRGLTDWEAGEKNQKRALIDTLTKVRASPLYALAFDRWLMLTYQKPQRFAQTAAMIDGRLFTGLATGGTLETGVCTHHTYGVPMLPGSGIKGAVRSYAHSIGLEGKYLQVLFGSDEEEDAVSTASGSLIWHDAWWLEGHEHNARTPFVGEVITVHHQEYYSESSAAADGSESPIPNQQLAVQGGFYFVIEGDPQWAQFAMDLLKNALFEQGMGAKSASGYGYFKADQRLQNRINRLYQELFEKQPVVPGDPDQLLTQIIQALNEKQLVDALTTGKSKFYRDKLKLSHTNEDDKKTVCLKVWELHQALVKSWENSQGNKLVAYNLISRYINQ